MARILVVDDEEKIRKIYTKLLLSEQHDVLEAADAVDAARLLIEDRKIDLILLDINLPVSDGGILYRMIRMLDPRIKVIVTSAYPLQDQKNRIERADDYYDKSQGIRVLSEKIKNQLESPSLA